MKNFSLNAEQKILVEKNLGVVRFAIHKNIIVNDNLFGFEYHRIISSEEYETVEGTCVVVLPKPLRRYRKIKIMDDKGNESSMLLGKQSKVKIGYRYRFYFKETQHISLGSEYLDSAMSSDSFLGYEELGEYAADTTE